MNFWLNYRDENHHIERIPIAVKNINHLFYLASEVIEADRLYLILLSDNTRIDDLFWIKRYLSLKNILVSMTLGYF